MKYNLNGFDREDFTRIDALVRATILAGGRVETWNSVRRVTTEVPDLDRARHHVVEEELAKGPIRAITFTSTHNQHEFDIWINPSVVDAEDPNFRATLLHELCHGYLGTQREHDRVWRRLFARTLFHYHYAAYTIEHYEALVDLSNWRYTKRGRQETTAAFLTRINADRILWLDQAEQEFDKVHQTWRKMVMGHNWVTTSPPSRHRRTSRDSSH